AQAEGEVVALAHHRDDQAETVLLRLLRGSADGLAGMARLRRFGRGWLWRPLLAVPRERLLAHARAAGLAWIEDPSNRDPAYDRNYLRQDVLPRLRARWPGADAALARSGRLLAEQAALLAGEDRRRLAQVQGADPATLSVPALAAQPPAWRARLLRAWLAGLGLPPLPGRLLDRVAQGLLAARADALPELAWSGAVLRRWRDSLYAGRPQPPLPADRQADRDRPPPQPPPCRNWPGRAPCCGAGATVSTPAGRSRRCRPTGRRTGTAAHPCPCRAEANSCWNRRTPSTCRCACAPAAAVNASACPDASTPA